MAYGYGGNILHIDLSKGKVTKTPTSEYAKLFVGGRGVNAKLMFDLSKPGVDAFDPENPIIIGAGALAGTGLLAGVKHTITTRSPEQVPQGLAMQKGGGSLSAEMKHAGYDHIVIKGRAEKPTYIHIENEDVALKDASGLWGQGIFKTNVILREEVDDPEVKIMAIGQAGERLVRFATIEHEYRSGTGLGGVWGSKNLKAIAVRGTKGVKVYDPEAILKINEEQLERYKERREEMIRLARERGEPEPSPYHTVGASAVRSWFYRSEMGVIGWLEGFEWSELDKTEGVPWLDTRGYHGSGCCPIACAGVVTVPGVGTCVYRCYPFWNLSQVKMTDMDAMFEAAMLMSDYGMDNKSLSWTVTYLMYLYDKGIITAKDTDGIPMEWGSGNALIETVHKVANREGFGDVLADGPLKLAKKLGSEAEARFYHNRGQVVSGDELRTQVGYALAKAVDTHRYTEQVLHGYTLWERYLKKIGEEEYIKEAYARAKKTYGTEKAIIPWEWEGKPIMAVNGQNSFVIQDSLGACGTWLRGPLEEAGRREVGTLPSLVTSEVLAAFNAVTGLNVDEKYLITAADRIWNVEKAYGVREGFTRDDDVIAEGWHKVPIGDGPHKGRVVDKAQLEKAKSKYYELRGWDVETGWPTKETYERLGLKDVAKSLEKLGRIPKKKAK